MAFDESQSLPQRTRSLPRSQGQGHRIALHELAWFRKPRSQTAGAVEELSATSSRTPPPNDGIDRKSNGWVQVSSGAEISAKTRNSSLRRVPATIGSFAQAANSTFLSSSHAHTFNAGRQIESISQKLMAAAVETGTHVQNTSHLRPIPLPTNIMPKPRATNNQSYHRPVSPAVSEQTTACEYNPATGSKGLEKLIKSFPDVAYEPQPPRDFVCSLDHAGIRWYGRIFIASRCLFFTGTGISLNGKGGTSQRSTSGGPSRAYSDTAWDVLSNSKSVTSLASATNDIRSPNALYNTVNMDNGCKKPWRRTAIRVMFRDITRVSKELTMGFWPNAITVGTTHRQFIFTNFLRRDRAYRCLSDAWQETKQQPVANINGLGSSFSSVSFAASGSQSSPPLPVFSLTHDNAQPKKQLKIQEKRVSSGSPSSVFVECESESTVCETSSYPEPTTRCGLSDPLPPMLSLNSAADSQAQRVTSHTRSAARQNNASVVTQNCRIPSNDTIPAVLFMDSHSSLFAVVVLTLFFFLSSIVFP
ncbi:hypothetical protein GGI05_000410 [Coemansia sp. RSA 2603]|nr:hypothetical protein GGI05_000410 [Coemansia sp. RSA 2603]